MGKLDFMGIPTIKNGPEGGRDLEFYENFLKFKKEDLEGKVVLDLGAGEKIKFSRELKKSGINTNVISLSPDYTYENQRKLLKPKLWEKVRMILEGEDHKDMVISGLAEELPFKNNSFDEVLSLFSVSTWSEENYKVWLPEIFRVLKDGGIGRIGPFINPKIDLYDGDISFKKRDEMLNYIDSLGYKYELIQSDMPRYSVLIIYKSKLLK